jgi:hypothetical protein
MAKRKPEPSKALMRTFDVLLKPTDPDPKPGDRISDAHGELRCMAVAEGLKAQNSRLRESCAAMATAYEQLMGRFEACQTAKGGQP